jgi:peptidoglycan/xylan/chitin deacetylase (PgdA/CDA1 family)
MDVMPENQNPAQEDSGRGERYRDGLKPVCSSTRLLSTPVLMYHRVAITAAPRSLDWLIVSPESFEAQMSHLAEKRVRVVPLADLLRMAPERKCVAITFDDGYLDIYTRVFPILKRLGFPATVFTVTGFVGKTSSWSSRAPVRLMDWPQLRNMSANGISIQSHTCTHPDLTRLPDDAVFKEFRDSRERIREMLGSPADHVAYPFGKFDLRICRLAHEAGYRSAWTAGLADGGTYSGERFRVTGTEGRLMFMLKTSRWASLLRRLRHLRLSSTA